MTDDGDHVHTAACVGGRCPSLRTSSGLPRACPTMDDQKREKDAAAAERAANRAERASYRQRARRRGEGGGGDMRSLTLPFRK